MSGEIISFIVLGLFVALLIAAAITDIRSRIISNRLNVIIAALAPLYWVVTGLTPWPDMALQLALGIATFGFFALLFAFGLMGGGDVKLLAAVALWFPWQAMVMLLILMSVFGGVLTLITIVHHRLRKREGQPEIPYGVAISVAALWLVGERIVYQFTG